MDRIRFVLILAVVVFALLLLLFVVDVQGNFNMLLNTEKGMMRQLTVRLTRIEWELGIDSAGELLGFDIER